MITIKELEKNLEEIGYYATEKLIYDTFNALSMMGVNTNKGQDIYALCLEGPPGAGKTEFTKAYIKLVNKTKGYNVEMVDYQCDATTGKTELFEDINIGAAIANEPDKVNIPGKLIETIRKVNEGKHVILFLDEYDKAREETDAFLLQFLQSGKINSVQHGDLEIKESYKKNLQVFLCKNDMREELSGPLSRRLRILRLDHMTPEIFYKVANNALSDKSTGNLRVNDGIFNLVMLMYQNIYNDREVYGRLPACSEMLMAIQDADRLLKEADAPQHIIYDTLVRTMLKSEDDIITFNSRVVKDSKLRNIVSEMSSRLEKEESVDINSLIAEKVFSGETSKLAAKTKEMEELIVKSKKDFIQMKENLEKFYEDKNRKIMLEHGKLVNDSELPKTASNFEDQSKYIKRGSDIYRTTEREWVSVGTITSPDLVHYDLINKLVEDASELNIEIHENGIMLANNGELKLIVVKNNDEKDVYQIMSSSVVIPSTYINKITEFSGLISEVGAKQNTPTDKSSIISNISTLIYDNQDLPYPKEGNNTYLYEFEGNCNVESFTCSDVQSALMVSNSFQKVKKD